MQVIFGTNEDFLIDLVEIKNFKSLNKSYAPYNNFYSSKFVHLKSSCYFAITEYV